MDLATGEILSAGIRTPIKKPEKASTAKKNAVFNRVVAAAKRLMEVVLKNDGLSNKDLAKLESQILNLADKWDVY